MTYRLIASKAGRERPCHDYYDAKLKRQRIEGELEELNSLINQFVDDQYGLDCGGGWQRRDGDEIHLYSYGSMSREEWVDCGEELVIMLEHEGFGIYEVSSAGTNSCDLLRKEE